MIIIVLSIIVITKPLAKPLPEVVQVAPAVTAPPGAHAPGLGAAPLVVPPPMSDVCRDSRGRAATLSQQGHIRKSVSVGPDRMAPSSRLPARHMLAYAPLLVVLVLAVALRLEDPLSSPVIPAEDPYTHMALVREHMVDGEVEPLNPDTGLYPPGFHAAVAATWAYSGAQLFDIIRFGPVLLGVIGVLGMAMLVGRHEGPVASFVAALAYAVMPEAVFRTTMMAPTALDLAILPFLLYALIELVRGNVAWGLPVALCATFLLLSHPWLLAVLALAGVLFAVFALLFPWRQPPALDARGLAIAVMLVAVPAALSLTGCSGWCGGFDFVVQDGGAGEDLAAQAPLIVASAVLASALLALAARPLSQWLRRERRAPSLASGLAIALVLAVGVGLATRQAMQSGMPEFVDLRSMFGWPILILASVGLVFAGWSRGPVAHLGVALAISTYPFVIFNPLRSEFWPHRTAVYLGVGMVLLCGVAAGQLARWLQVAAASSPSIRRLPRAAGFALAVPVLLIAIPAASALYLATPQPLQRPWYRLFDECGDAALHDLADQADAAPTMLVVTGSWQSKLVIAAYATDAQRIWFTAEFFTDEGHRKNVLDAAAGRPVVAVVDPHFRGEHPTANLSFLSRAPWSEAGTWCTDANGSGPPAMSATSATSATNAPYEPSNATLSAYAIR